MFTSVNRVINNIPSSDGIEMDEITSSINMRSGGDWFHDRNEFHCRRLLSSIVNNLINLEDKILDTNATRHLSSLLFFDKVYFGVLCKLFTHNELELTIGIPVCLFFEFLTQEFVSNENKQILPIQKLDVLQNTVFMSDNAQKFIYTCYMYFAGKIGYYVDEKGKLIIPQRYKSFLDNNKKYGKPFVKQGPFQLYDYMWKDMYNMYPSK